MFSRQNYLVQLFLRPRKVAEAQMQTLTSGHLQLGSSFFNVLLRAIEVIPVSSP